MPSTGEGGATPGALAHGGRVAEARRRFPGAPEPWLDLSTGINPVPYPVAPLPAACFSRLPEPAEIAELEAAAAAAYCVADPAMVVASPGTQVLIGLLPLLWPLASVAVPEPTYAEHAAAWRRAGATVHGDLHRPTDGVVLCNPNNPDGRRIAPDRLLALADRLGDGLLVIDEAFADLEPGAQSLAPALPHPAVVVLRSFGKPYGLAGLRLGFAIAAQARAAAIRAALGPWAVSGPAVAIGRAALADPAWRAAAAARLADDARALDRCLEAAGLRVIGGTSLFRLAETDEADPVFRRLGAAGILVRRFDEHPRWLRFGQPPDRAGLARLRAALAGKPR